MDSRKPICTWSCTHTSTQGFIVSKRPAPLDIITPKGQVIHCPLRSCWHSLRSKAGEGTKQHINNPLGCLYIACGDSCLRPPGETCNFLARIEQRSFWYKDLYR